MTNTCKLDSLIAYYRVSTRGQAESGLGIEAQKAAVKAYAGDRYILDSFTEVESGKRSDNRPKLQEALARCRRSKATLVVAKLDRLARNVAFTSALMDSGVEFVCCDNPHATRLTIHILAAVAEDEARRISERTKAALRATKARGTKLGGANPACRNLTQEDRQNGARISAEVRHAAAASAYDDLHELISGMRNGGFSFADIATLLNMRKHTTRTGHPWTPMAVLRHCKRTEPVKIKIGRSGAIRRLRKMPLGNGGTSD